MTEPAPAMSFFVWNPNRDTPRYRHADLKSATEEARRLASQNAGQRFYVLAPVAVARTEPRPVSLAPIDPTRTLPSRPFDLDDEIPF